METTPLLKVCLKTYGAIIPDSYFTGLSNLNFARDCLYRFRVTAFALTETRQSITQLARESNYGIVIPVRSTWIYDVWYRAFLVSCNVTSLRAKQIFGTCIWTSQAWIAIILSFFFSSYFKAIKQLKAHHEKLKTSKEAKIEGKKLRFIKFTTQFQM